MSAVAPSDSVRRSIAGQSALEWWIVLGGFLSMYAPIYWWAAGSIWQSEEHGHGVIILGVLAWLFWYQRRQIDAAPREPAHVLGWALLTIGLGAYFIGRVLDISILQFASQPFVVAAALLLMRGPTALRLAWFPTLYFLFMIPLPGALVDLITGSLKQWISAIVEHLLYFAGYPIARTGVIISIGPYQLQVADACSGLHSMFSLAALGILFIYLRRPRSKAHVAVMLASIVPIAFGANIIRVTLLVLITYYFGDAAGQGFLHNAAGMVLFLAALGLLMALDAVVASLRPPMRRPQSSD